MFSPDELTPREAASGIFGAVSLAAWIFLLVPQLIENYRLQSAEGISLLFLSVWFLGDITNLLGAIWAGLIPSVVALAVYFCFADLVLILQCIYFNVLNARRQARLLARKSSNQTRPNHQTDSTTALDGSTAPSESSPLLGNLESSVSSLGLPGSHRRRRSSMASSLRRTNSAAGNTLASLFEEGEESGRRAWIRNTASVAVVCLAGAAGWAIAWRTGVWMPIPNGPGEGEEKATEIALGAEILGYTSAVCYLGARIPQIIKNQRSRSCEGLSLLFFILSLIGNSTYGASILFHSLDKDYLLVNTPWLIGSIGTIAEDITIFIQFHVFKNRGEDHPNAIS